MNLLILVSTWLNNICHKQTKVLQYRKLFTFRNLTRPRQQRSSVWKESRRKSSHPNSKFKNAMFCWSLIYADADTYAELLWEKNIVHTLQIKLERDVHAFFLGINQTSLSTSSKLSIMKAVIWAICVSVLLLSWSVHHNHNSIITNGEARAN